MYNLQHPSNWFSSFLPLHFCRSGMVLCKSILYSQCYQMSRMDCRKRLGWLTTNWLLMNMSPNSSPLCGTFGKREMIADFTIKMDSLAGISRGGSWQCHKPTPGQPTGWNDITTAPTTWSNSESRYAFVKCRYNRRSKWWTTMPVAPQPVSKCSSSIKGASASTFTWHQKLHERWTPLCRFLESRAWCLHNQQTTKL